MLDSKSNIKSNKKSHIVGNKVRNNKKMKQSKGHVIWGRRILE